MSPKKPSRRVSRRRKPEEMSVEQWQVALRRQIALDLDLDVENIGSEPVFSEFRVTNPASDGSYRVAIRGEALGVNFCSCPDFAVNTLGTCKHIEYVLEALKRKSSGRAALHKGFSPEYSEVFLRYGPQREVVFKPGTKCPPEVRRAAGEFFDERGVLGAKAFVTFHRFHALATGGGHEVRFYDDALEFVAHVRDREEFVRRVDALAGDGDGSTALDAMLKTSLYPYQRRGALQAARAGRCLIADEMGLGKTVQAIAACEVLARAGGVERVLVVCPTSLKHQWRREVEAFCDRAALVVEGPAAERDAGYRAEGWFYKIVNYDVVYRDLERIAAWQPDLVILDEAQRIKNWSTRTAKSVKRLDSEFAIVLTGTPLENRLEELHSIVEFVDRYRLGPLFRFLAEHQQVDDGGRVVGYRNLSSVARTLGPILIRRTKSEVASELPERTDKRLFVPMTREQQRHHEENQTIVARLVQKWRRHGFLSEIDQRRLTCALQNMRMACDSTYLLDRESDHGHKVRELSAVLQEALEEPDSKVVIFSQWLRMHELIERELERCGFDHVLFHGGVASKRRKVIIERFRQDPGCRVFLSTDAGGVGLNLQNADTVVNVDQPWNPAVLEQRVGRVHRLGQRRAVRVVHLIAKDTIEERILDLLAFKQDLFRGVLDGGRDEVYLGGTRLNKFMEAVERTTGEGSGAAPKAAPVVQTELQPARQAAGQSVDIEAAAQAQALGQLVTAAAGFLGSLTGAMQSPESGKPHPLIETDPATGQRHLRIPLPPAEKLQALAALLQTMTGGA